EDGIRDRNVTGVQTCALPISTSVGWVSAAQPTEYAGSDLGGLRCADKTHIYINVVMSDDARPASLTLPANGIHTSCRSDFWLPRSEERRVGKECRSWWGAWQE